MAEFPDLGAHCFVSECQQLDILPIRCDACGQTVCRQHITYESHRCPNGHIKNVTVPQCPLCQRPVPVGKRENLDVKINEHIERDCQSDPAEKFRRRALLCQLAKCRKFELVRMPCSLCNVHFCLAHRHGSNHGCPGRVGVNNNPLLRKPFNYNNLIASNTGNLQDKTKANQAQTKAHRTDEEEDEALARALQASLLDTNEHGPQKQLGAADSDFELARRLQEEEYNQSNTEDGRGRIRNAGRTSSSNGSSCIIS